MWPQKMRRCTTRAVLAAAFTIKEIWGKQTHRMRTRRPATLTSLIPTLLAIEVAISNFRSYFWRKISVIFTFLSEADDVNVYSIVYLTRKVLLIFLFKFPVGQKDVCRRGTFAPPQLIAQSPQCRGRVRQRGVGLTGRPSLLRLFSSSRFRRSTEPTDPSHLAALGPPPSSPFSLQFSVMALPPCAPFACYLLVSQSRAHVDHTYIGFTVHPPRRLRQHNGEIKGGAHHTHKKRPWYVER